jgi:hypothetical protein
MKAAMPEYLNSQQKRFLIWYQETSLYPHVLEMLYGYVEKNTCLIIV